VVRRNQVITEGGSRPAPARRPPAGKTRTCATG